MALGHAKTAVELRSNGNDWNVLGVAYYRNGDWKRAAATLHKARDMKITVLGEEHPDLAITLHNLGCCAIKLGDNNRAREYLTAAIEMLRPTVDPSHPTLVSCRTKLEAAACQDFLGRFLRESLCDPARRRGRVVC